MSTADHPDHPGAGVPPGQRVLDTLPVKHYGPIPRAETPTTWTMTFGGATAGGTAHDLSIGELAAMPQSRVIAGLH